jgi:hypothetical protein
MKIITTSPSEEETLARLAIALTVSGRREAELEAELDRLDDLEYLEGLQRRARGRL